MRKARPARIVKDSSPILQFRLDNVAEIFMVPNDVQDEEICEVGLNDSQRIALAEKGGCAADQS